MRECVRENQRLDSLWGEHEMIFCSILGGNEQVCWLSPQGGTEADGIYAGSAWSIPGTE